MRDHPQEQQPEPRRTNPALFFQWLLMGGLGLVLFALAGAHAPERIKLIGLFAIAHGLAAGWGLAKLADAMNLSAHKTTVCLSFVLIAAGQVGMAVESHRLYAAHLRRQFESRPDVFPAPELFEKVREERRRKLAEKTRFSAYLARRISPLGAWPAPWPTVFWSIEVLLGSAAGGWLVHRSCSTRSGNGR